MRHISLSNKGLEGLADPRTDLRLLPEAYRGQSNGRRMRHCKAALNKAMENCVSQRQREHLHMHFGEELSKSEIAKRCGTTCSAISKSLAAGLDSVRTYIRMYMDIYDAVEQDFLRDDIL